MNPNTDAVKDLREAKKLLRKPDAWTKGAYARTPDGADVDYEYPGAVCFCLQGALDKVSNTYVNSYVEEAIRRQTRGRFDEVIAFNDHEHRRHSHILSVLDKAIDLAKKGS